MKKIIFTLSVIFITTVLYSQEHLHSGKNNITTSLFDSGSVSLGVNEFNFDKCGSTHEIYKCVFTFKNLNTYPIILKRYSFYTYNDNDTAGNIPCSVSNVSRAKNSDTVAANSTKTITIYGETLGIYQSNTDVLKTGCTYHWQFNGFMPLKK
jgi:hypothetical protein